MSETLVLQAANPRFLSAIGPTSLVAALGYLIAWGAAILATAFLYRFWRLRIATISLLAYLVISVKMFALDAVLLQRPLACAAFVVFTAAVFGALYWVTVRFPQGYVALVVFPVVFFLGSKTLSAEWGARGGNLVMFLFSWRTVLIGVASLIVTLGTTLVAMRWHRVHVALVAALVGVASLFMVATTMATSPHMAEGKRSGASQSPDIYVLSVDALRKDLLDEWCASGTGTLKQLCKTGTRYERVISDGLSTRTILARNVGTERSCRDSVPEQLRNSGYSTLMYMGRKNTPVGKPCFDIFFMGEGEIYLNRYSVMALWDWLRGKSDTERSRFIPAPHLLARMRSDVANLTGPVFVYAHLLEMHGPYKPSNSNGDAALQQAVNRYMRECYAVACDPRKPEYAELIAVNRRAYENTRPDVERAASHVMETAKARGRPFVLILTADHGELFGEHGGFAHSGGFVQELLSVPFLVAKFGGQQAAVDAARCDLLLSSEAIQHVVAEIAGHERPTTGSHRVRVDGAPLGHAYVDVKQRRVEYHVSPAQDSNRGTWRNIHRKHTGFVPFVSRECDGTLQ